MGTKITLQNLSEYINELVGTIENGGGDKDTIDNLLDATTQLQERLYILRYKAYEESLGVANTPEQVQEKPIHLKFGSAAISPNQISLIDVIQEVEPETTETVKQQEPIKEDVPTQESIKITPPVVTDRPTTSSNISQKSANSINDKHIHSSEPNSLGDKLGRTPISDLKKAIGINQKFLFINELFQQNADEYNASVDFINKADSLDDAQIYINSKLISRYNWDLENKHVENFMELVERKFL